MQLQIDESGKAGELTFSGALTIQRAHDFHAALLNGIKQVQHLRLHLTQVAEIDLSFMQLICATHRRLLKEGKKLTMSGPGVGEFQRASVLAGYQECVAGQDQIGIWKGVAN